MATFLTAAAFSLSSEKASLIRSKATEEGNASIK